MADFEIYTGVWWDYSAGAGVLTLPVSSAAYLISGLTLLVSLAGVAMWMMVAYIWHQSGVAHDGPVDYRHLQLQVLLRNVSTPASALVHAAKLLFVWPKTGSSHLARLLVLAMTAGLIMALFSVAGVFVGAGVASPSQEDILVLAKPVLCGDVQVLFDEDSSGERYSAAYAWKASQAFRAREYAKVWYAANVSSAAAGSSAYPARRLPYTTSRVPCPFPGQRCRFSVGNASDVNTAIAFDTGLLDSSVHLGINAPVHRTMQFRRKTTCMPIRGADLWVNNYFDDTDNQTYSLLVAGPYQGRNATLIYNEQMTQMGLGYHTGAVSYDSNITVPGGWRPIPLLARNDSVVHLFNILANSINYADLVDDPIFQVSGVINHTFTDTNRTIYFADYFATTLVCLDQFQFCNPQNGLCTPESTPLGAMGHLLEVEANIYQIEVVRRIVNMLVDADMYSSGPGNLGISALLANELVLRNSISPSLPPDQWIRETRLWFETGLSIIQERTLLMLDISPFSNNNNNTTTTTTTTTTTNSDGGGAFSVQPMASRTPDFYREAGEWECTSQKIRARPGQAQNFSVARLVGVVVAAGAVVVLGWVLEPCVALVRRVRGEGCGGGARGAGGVGYGRGRGRMRQFARATDNLYWLLHAGLRGAGAGEYPWRYGNRSEEDGEEEGVVRDEEVPMLDVPGQFWPPVDDDGSWAPFYRCPPVRSVDDLAVRGESPEMSAQNGHATEGLPPGV